MKYFATLALILSNLLVWAQDFEGLLPLNNTELFVKVIGKGSPIIIIHGGPGLNHTYFLPHLNDLSKKHKLIFYDQRACGRSSGKLDSTQLTMELLINDIESIRKHLHLEKVSILAHSWGGLLGMEYAFTFPDNIKSLILVNSVSPASGEFEAETNATINKRYSKQDSTTRARILRSNEFKAGDLPTIHSLFMLSFKQTFYNQQLTEKLNLVLPADFKAKREKLFFLSKDLSKYNYYAKLNGIKCPTLIIHGSYDGIPIDLPRKIQSNIPGARLHSIEQAGHFPFVEQPREFTKAINQFLNP
jgi:proline iminopeptidase